MWSRTAGSGSHPASVNASRLDGPFHWGISSVNIFGCFLPFPSLKAENLIVLGADCREAGRREVGTLPFLFSV